MNKQLLYTEALKSAMGWLSSKSDTIFVGQTVSYPGTALYETFSLVDSSKKLEFPVAENFQLGFSVGLALTGVVPVSVFPRWNFLLSATDQLVNHLDKLPDMSSSEFLPKVIIRVAVGSKIPLDPQEQHKGNFSDAFRLMFSNIDIIELDSHETILDNYKFAYNRTDGKSTILVEFSDYGKE